MSVLLEAMHATQRVFRTSNRSDTAESPKESRGEDGSQKERYELTVAQRVERVI
jgi:hypothetical protein